MSCLFHSLGSNEKWSGVHLENRFQSHEDHEMPKDQPGLQQTKKKNSRFMTCLYGDSFGRSVKTLLTLDLGVISN